MISKGVPPSSLSFLVPFLSLAQTSLKLLLIPLAFLLALPSPTALLEQPAMPLGPA